MNSTNTVPSAVELVAEIGQAHDGSLGLAHSFIDALAGTGVHAVKFQVHIAEAESSHAEPFRVHFSKQDATRFDYWRRMEFTPEQWAGIKAHCDEKGIEFFASPFSVAAVNLLENLGVRRYKIGSGEMANLLMLDRIAQTGKPIILSSGLSTFEDLDQTIEFLRPFGNKLSLLQCTTNYPTKAANLGLNVISQLKARYGIPIGFSDHSGTIFAAIAAVALGAELLEFHVVFDRRQFGPDSSSSLEVRELGELVHGVRFVSEALASPMDKSQLHVLPDLRRIFGKSLAINDDLPAGHRLRVEDLESKKPGDCGIPAAEFQRVIGRQLSRALHRWDFLNEADLSQA
jgi:N-acetylneuraminate synthase